MQWQSITLRPAEVLWPVPVLLAFILSLNPSLVIRHGLNVLLLPQDIASAKDRLMRIDLALEMLRKDEEDDK